MKRSFLSIVLVLSAAAALYADSLDDVKKNPCITASNHYAYPDSDLPALSAAPDGYEPIYMVHYGRHGSRWLCGRDEYDVPVKAMEGIDKAQHLTPLGKETLAELKAIQKHAHNRWGELTDIGAEQHQRIGHRMGVNFPELFSHPESRVVANSSVVNRCILSMTNEMQSLAALYPELDITTDASSGFMWLLATGTTAPLRKHASKAGSAVDSLRHELTKYDRFVAQLVDDQAYARDSVDGFALIRAIFNVAGIQQNHHAGRDLYHLFTPEELHAIWQGENASHYVDYSHAPQSDNVMPFGESHLLRHLISHADSALMAGTRGADLHFGHEVFFLPLVCLMELGNCSPRIEDVHDVAEQWHSYEIFPMACNVQMIFYRNPTDESAPVLVKALLNEREVSLPVKPADGNYYAWDDLRNYYTTKINAFEEYNPGLMPVVPKD